MKNSLWMLFFFLLILSVSCTSKKKVKGTGRLEESALPVLPFAEYVEKSVPDTFTWNSLQRHVRFIPLETSPESLISSSIGIYYKEGGNILVTDYKMESIFLFDKNGTLLNHFNHMGKGPGEYINLTFVSYGESDTLIQVFDSGNRRLLFYSPDGLCVKSVSTKDVFNGNVVYIGAHDVITFNNAGDYRICIYDHELMLLRQELPYDSTYSESVRFFLPLVDAGSRDSDKFIYNPVNSDTVYAYSEEQSGPFFLLKKGKYRIPDAELTDVFALYMKEYNNFVMVFGVTLFSRYALIKYSYKGLAVAEIWDMTTLNILSRTPLQNYATKESFSRGIAYRLPSGLVLHLFPKYVTQKRLVFLIPAEEMMDDLKGLSEEDNPVLMIMDL